jgi:glutamate synthase (NADPH/NADH) small chain
MEKWVLDRRLKQMEAEGVQFVCNAHVGENVDAGDLRRQHDAVVLCGGASQPRDLQVPGRELKGAHFAVDYLTQANKVALGEKVENQILATGKHVVILGGGDTGADCLGTAVRQGAKSIKQFELLPRPPQERAPDNPWPEWHRIFMVASAHEECEVRDYCIETIKLTGEKGVLKKLHAHRLDWVPSPNGGRPQPKPVAGSAFDVACDLLFLAMGFLGSEKPGMIEQLDVKLTERQNVWHAPNRMTSVPGVFVAGDMARGQSLIVWAIAEGRTAARGVDEFLMGTTNLPSPI